MTCRSVVRFHPAGPGYGRRRTRRWPATQPVAVAIGRQRGTSWPHRLEPPRPHQPGGEGEGGEQVIPLQVLVVGQDLVGRHPGTEQLEEHLDGVAEATDTRLAMADVRVDGDSGKQWVHSEYPFQSRQAGP